MNRVKVRSQDVRIPAEATEALAEGVPVAVTRYGSPTHVLLSEEQFGLVEPLLEMLQKGAAVSPELLMSENDIELMSDLANDREPAEAEAAQLEQLIADELV
jgi:hypothetical protein